MVKFQKIKLIEFKQIKIRDILYGSNMFYRNASGSFF